MFKQQMLLQKNPVLILFYYL